MQRRVRDGAAQPRVGLCVDRAWIDEPLDQPHRRAVGETLELRDAERATRGQLVEHGPVGQPGGPLERAQRAFQPPLPAVRERERGGRVRVVGRERGEAAHAFALGRCGLERPGERGERPAARPPPDVVGVEEASRLLPEGARATRCAVVARGGADEQEPLGRARARRVEEVAVARSRIRPRQPSRPVELPPQVVAEERGRDPAPRQAPLLQAEHEDDVGASRPRAHEVEHDDAPTRRTGRRADRRTLERREDLVARRAAGQLRPLGQLVERPADGVERPQVCAAVVARRRRVEAVRQPDHRLGERPRGLDGVSVPPQLVEQRQRGTAQPEGLVLHALVADGPPAEPALDEVDVRPGQAGVRRAQEAEQVAPRRRTPVEAQQREQRLAEGRALEPRRRVDAERERRGCRTPSPAARGHVRATGRRRQSPRAPARRG